MRRREFITVIGAVAGLPLVARAQETGRTPPREIQTLIDNHINGFNTQNIDLFLGVFGDTAIIIDGIAPYRWLNPNAPANWLMVLSAASNNAAIKIAVRRIGPALLFERLWEETGCRAVIAALARRARASISRSNARCSSPCCTG